MKQIILSLIAICSAFAAQAQSCVTIQQVSTNYATKQITFDLKWGTCNNANHLYRVWVFVDYRPVTITTKGAWSRATITATDKGTLVSANNGVWVTGSANATQRVTFTLNVIGDKFDWCAFAIDYPPNATMNNGVYTLKGTPPFIINGAKLGDTQKTYTGNITVITDATNNPDGFIVTCPQGQTMNSSGKCVAYTTTCTAGWVTGMDTGTSSFSGCTSSKGGILKIQKADAGCPCWKPNNYCPIGWRWPTRSELQCMYNNRSAIGGFDISYWSSEEYTSTSAWHRYFNTTGSESSSDKTFGGCVRCVQ